MEREQKHVMDIRNAGGIRGAKVPNNAVKSSYHVIFLQTLHFVCFFFFLCFSVAAKNESKVGSGANGDTASNAASTCPECSSLLESAVQRIRNLKSIKSNILMNVFMDDQEYIARGEYLEKMFTHKPGEMALSKFRLELKFPLSANSSGNVSNHMIVVCKDNSRVWHYSSIENRKVQNWIDIRRVLDAAKASKKPHQLSALGGMPGLGGLEGMLRSLERNYEFTEPPEEKALKGKDPLPVWMLRGKMCEESINALIRQREWHEDKNKALPELFPLYVEIYLGRDDYFPYRIHYYNAANINAKKRILMTELIYCDVLLNSEISDYHFNTFDEQSARAHDGSDITNQYIRSLGL